MIANRKTRMFAVEKNAKAVITLRNLKISEKWDNVTIAGRHHGERAPGLFCRQRTVSECLDGAQAFLPGKPTCGAVLGEVE
jgi:protein arginine N-methyltransferase 5